MLIRRFSVFIFSALFIFLVISSNNKSIYKINNVNHKKYVKEYIAVDLDFNEDEKELIVAAAELWQEATNNTVEFTFLYSYNPNLKIEHNRDTIVYPIILKHITENSPLTKFIDVLVGGDMLGYYKQNEVIPTIYIVESRISSLDEYELVIAHEIGHSMQLLHSSNKYALMAPHISDIEGCITKSDIELFCDQYNCDVEDMNYCITEEELICPNDEI